MTATSTLSPLKLTDAMKDAVNGALGRGKPLSVAYVDELGQPHLSYRGSVQSFDDSRLALWTRDAGTGMATVIASHPSIVLLYGDLNPENRVFLTFRGQARVDNSESVRRTVFENSHPAEQERDKDRKGAAVIIDLDSIDGLIEGSFVQLRRV